ncbi:hypothetical protein [Pseudooceanicola nanhaiensis]|jgi:ABC-type glycerol-3-phosphate transport system permease component|uniref:hypothetical protein n=1 Tax=Pseudooceanicola nanhaiensis TaxID=375761 RepID=UPI00405A020F
MRELTTAEVSMTTTHSKRRVQIVCAAFLHIPIVAIAAYAVATGSWQGAGTLLLVGLVATVAGTVLIVPYVGRVLDGQRLQPAE